MVTCTIHSVKFLLLLVVGNFLVSVADAGSATRSLAVHTNAEESTIVPRHHKIVGGQEVVPGSVPHQISFRIRGGHRCGGSIIDASWIITAAHCVHRTPVQLFSVVAGLHNILDRNNNTQFRQVSAKIVHENYKESNDTNTTPDIYDIALLKLSSPLILGPDQRTRAIPLANYSVEAGTLATVTGWGKTSEGGTSSDVLLSVTVPIVSDKSCRNDYSQAEILDNMICAGLEQGGKDSCQGDSGGPLVVTVNGETQLVGIVSWGPGCARPKSPGVYTEVKYFVDWVKSKMN